LFSVVHLCVKISKKFWYLTVMTTPNIPSDTVMFILFLVIVIGVALPFSSFFVRVFADMSRGIPGSIEQTIYRLTETSPDREEGRWGYSRNMLIFNGIGFILLLILLFLQGFLPFYSQNFRAFDLYTSINAVISFVTNTNWQVYSVETAASLGLTKLNGEINGFKHLTVQIRSLSHTSIGLDFSLQMRKSCSIHTI